MASSPSAPKSSEGTQLLEEEVDIALGVVDSLVEWASINLAKPSTELESDVSLSDTISLINNFGKLVLNVKDNDEQAYLAVCKFIIDGNLKKILSVIPIINIDINYKGLLNHLLKFISSLKKKKLSIDLRQYVVTSLSAFLKKLKEYQMGTIDKLDESFSKIEGFMVYSNGLLLLQHPDVKICYLSCVNYISQTLTRIAEDMCKITMTAKENFNGFVIAEKLIELMRSMEFVVLPHINLAIGFHNWNIAVQEDRLVKWAAVHDWCTSIENSPTYENFYRTVPVMLKFCDFLSSHCKNQLMNLAKLSWYSPDSIKSFKDALMESELYRGVHLKKYKNELFPTFYNEIINLLKSLKVLISHFKAECINKQCFNSQSETLFSAVVDQCYCVINSLRIDFLKAKKYYIKLVLSSPVNTEKISIEGADHCKEEIRIIAQSIQQKAINTKDQIITLLSTCSNMIDNAFKLCAGREDFSKTLFMFIDLVLDLLQQKDNFQIESFSSVCLSMIEHISAVQKEVVMNSQLQQREVNCEFFEVNFYVIVRFSDWNLKGNDIRMSLEYCKNGAIPINVSDFSVVNWHSNNYAVMSTRVLFSQKFNGTKFFYKYMIFCNDYDSHEMIYIHDHNKQEVSQCFRVITLHLPSSGQLSIYDSCPHPQKKRFNVFVGTVFGKFMNDLEVPVLSNDIEHSIEAFLGESFDNIERVTGSDICALYHKTHTINESFIKAKKISIKQPHDERVMIQSGLRVNQLLEKKIFQTLQSRQDSKNIISKLLLCRLLVDFCSKLTDSTIKVILQSIQISYGSSQECIPYEEVEKNYYQIRGIKFTEAIVSCLQSLFLSKPYSFPWILMMRALPLHHWFSKDPLVKPFTELDMSPENIKAVIKETESLGIVRPGSTLKTKELQEILSELKPVELKGDPKLQVILLLACPEQEYSLLINRVALPIILIGLEHRLKSIGNAKVKEISCLLESISWKGRTLETTSAFLSILQKILTMISKNVVTAMMDFLSCIVNITLTLHDEESTPSNIKIDLLNCIIGIIKQLVTCYTESENFGGNNMKLVEEEYDYWSKLLTLTHENFQRKLQEVIEDRLTKIAKFDHKVDVYLKLSKSHRDDDPIVEIGCAVIEKKISVAKSKELQKLASCSHGKHVKKLFSQIIDRKFKNVSTITIEEVLQYENWPVFLTAYGTKGEGMSENSLAVYQKLYDILVSLRNDLSSGNVTPFQLKRYDSKWNEKIFPLLQPMSLNVEPFKSGLEMMKSHVNLFNFHRALLNHLTKNGLNDSKLKVHQLFLKPIQQLEVELMPINSLCTSTGEYPVLTEVAPLIPMLIPFAILTSDKFRNDIFYRKWNEELKQLDWAVTCSDIYHTLWIPVFDYCVNLLDDLEQQRITLYDAQHLFNGIGAKTISKTISHLADAVCYSKYKFDIPNLAYQLVALNDGDVASLIVKEANYRMFNWPETVSKNIELWSNLDPLLKEATEFADILNTYGVDSSNIVKFSQMDIRIVPLRSVLVDDQKNLLLFLKEYKETPLDVKNSVKELGHCVDLREWILNNSEDVAAMDTFIGVLMDTIAGEGDEIQDRLTCLSELCSRFYPLIYKLHKDRDLSKAIEIFKEAQENIQSLHDPLSVVTECQESLRWYLKIGELQGSIEQGSVEKLRDIINEGEFIIETGSKEHENCHIYLKVTGLNQVHSLWEMDELSELESKLVLITRTSSLWVKDKDIFLELMQKIQLISAAIQKLKNFGHLEYLSWKKEYSCSNYRNDLELLDQEIKDLESVLVGWVYNTWTYRYQYPELNYYTTSQLVILRRELTRIKNDPNINQVNPQLFHILQSTVGEPFESTMLLKQGLNFEDDNAYESLPHTPSSLENDVEINSVSIEESSEVTLLEDKNLSDIECKTEELSESHRKLYDELLAAGYEDFLILEAILNQGIDDDVYNIMDWCDELTNEEIADFKKSWTGTVNNSQTPSCEQSLLGANSETDTNSKMFVTNIISNEFDVSPIVNSFVNLGSDIMNRDSANDDESMLSLEELGKFMRNIATKRKVKPIKRKFPDKFAKGCPNLLIVSEDEMFNCVLEIYGQDLTAPLPTYDEVLLCSSKTTLEQVVVFWMRALFDKYHERIYCLVHAEKLNYLVADKAVDLLTYLSQGINEYQLVIVCSSKSEEKSHIITRLHSYHRNWRCETKDILQNYIMPHLKQDTAEKAHEINASIIDEDSLLLRVIQSEQAGSGKSLYIRRMKDRLTALLKEKGLFSSKRKPKVMISIPFHGPVVTPDEILKMLLTVTSVTKSCIVHIDIPQRVLHSVDDILFSLLILRGLSDSSGQIWRCHPTQFYAIEVTLPSEKNYIRTFPEARRVLGLLSILPKKECFPPTKMLQSIKLLNERELIDLRTPMYQRVYKYLKLLELKEFKKLEHYMYIGTLEDTDQECLNTIIRHCGTLNPTWKEVRHFVWFLNHQLSACEQSNMIRSVKGLKEFTVKFMIDMSRDFASSSIPTSDDGNTLAQHVTRQKWEDSVHPYLFFDKNRKSVTHVGLTLNGLQITPEVQRFLSNKVRVPYNPQRSTTSDILLERLLNFMNVYIKEGSVIESPDINYVLTEDNLTKIMGIQTRFRCQIPVVLMGETGCGKTHLIRFMCKIATYGKKDIKNMFILKIHGGTTEEDVLSCLKEAEKEALERNRQHRVDTVVFFDEANTSDVISLIKEIMCDGKCRGQPVPPFLKFVAACNPYRRHNEAMIEQLTRAGLGWRDKESSTSEKLGEIPLRELVYRVLQLPDSLKALVYDFGTLSSETEKDYVFQIVLSRLYEINMSDKQIKGIANVLAECQDYLKQNKDACSFVSLRDVERAMILFKFFYNDFIDKFSIQNPSKKKMVDSLLLSLSVSYFARLDSHEGDQVGARKKFEERICQVITQQLNSIKINDLKKLLESYQTNLLECMVIEDNIAKNAALRENLFMMFVCIELRIPLFLVGKPGSSKSLAKTIIQTSMKGKNSKNSKLRDFKQLQLHSYQCSELSTADSIKDVFETAVKYQEKRRQTQKDSSFVSVVVLDEVGLAEASPHLPLKSLHPLLEDGTEGSGSTDKRLERNERVAFIGISNWALDPAKMNRGIMVRRSDPTINDLKESAQGICTNKDGTNKNVLGRLKEYFTKLSNAYLKVFKEQPREFFGLRDFYSLIKMLYWMTDKSGVMITPPQLEHAIRRNFSGFSESEKFDPFKIFLEKCPELQSSSKVCGNSELLQLLRNNAIVVLQCKDSQKVLSCDGSDYTLQCEEDISLNSLFVVNLIDNFVSLQNLFSTKYLAKDQMANNNLTLADKSFKLTVKDSKDKKAVQFLTSHKQVYEINGESLFIPIIPPSKYSVVNPDCSPLGLIRESLINKDISKHGESRYLLFLTDNYSSLQILKHYIMTNCSYTEERDTNTEPFVLFGSSFPRDKDFAQVCRNISEIRLCMETGRMIILLNLENLYESLYDLLNQYYIKSGRHRYVDLGLRSHKMKCSVHENFKLILIAEKEKVYKDFPTPLVNRLEKHFINNETLLEEWQKAVCIELDEWINLFIDKDHSFNESDAFIGYSTDTKAAVVLQANAILVKQSEREDLKNKVLLLSKELLLQMASPDAIIRMSLKDKSEESKQLQKMYFVDQEHFSLFELINRMPLSDYKNVLLQVTTYDLSLTQKSLDSLKDELQIKGMQLDRAHLEAFQTEYEFLASIDNALIKGESQQLCQIYEYELGQGNSNLISCCRYRLVDKIKGRKNVSSTFFILLVHLPRKTSKSDFVSFQESPWICYHVDELLPSESSVSLLRQVSNCSVPLNELFYSENELQLVENNDCLTQHCQLDPIDESVLCQPVNLCTRLHSYISTTVSHSTDSSKIYHLGRLITDEPQFPLSQVENQLFYEATVNLMKQTLIKNENDFSCRQWITEVSMSGQLLQEGGTFTNALLRRFDKALAPLFLQIISFVNRNSNLELLPNINFENNKPLCYLWLEIYNSKKLCQDTLLNTMISPQNVSLSGKEFDCQFPFSWIIYNTINDIMMNDKDPSDDTELQYCFQSLSPNVFEDFTNLYLHDFVNLLRHTDSKPYCQLLINTFNNMISDIDFSNTSFVEILTKIHEVYFDQKDYFESFLDLASEIPSISNIEKSTSMNIKELLLFTLEEVLNGLYLDEKIPLKGKVALKGWMQRMYQLYAVVENIFDELDQGSDLLKKWQRLSVMKLFIEHVVIEFEEETLVYTKRLDMFCDKIDNYQGPQIFEFLPRLLIAVEKGITKYPLDKRVKILKCCWSFFVDVLSTFCTDLQLLGPLVKCVFVDANQLPKEDKLYSYIQSHLDQLIFLQTFVIKLLLSNNVSETSQILTDVIDRVLNIHQSVKKTTEQIMSLENVLTLTINYHKLTSCTSEIDDCADKLDDTCQQLMENDKQSPDHLLAVSQLMSSAQLLAKTLHEEQDDSDIDVVEHFWSQAEQHFQTSGINDDNIKSGPQWYLLQYIVRCYGLSTLIKAIDNLRWITGSIDIEEVIEEHHYVACGIIYNPHYNEYSRAIADATVSNGDFHDLLVKCDNSLNASHLVSLVLALYQRKQFSFTSLLPSNSLSSDEEQELHSFVKNCETWKSQPEVSKIVQCIINKDCSNIPQILMSPEDTIEKIMYRMIIVHTVLTVQVNRKSPLMKILHTLLNSPETLKDSFIPTMPIKVTEEAPQEIGFSECKNGHKFTSSMTYLLCTKCGNFVFPAQNALQSATAKQVVELGYVPLKEAEPVVGFVNGISCAIIRCILHSILLWATCDNKNVFALLNKRVQTISKDYFWDQLHSSLNELSKSIGRSIDEASLMIHLVLKGITQRNPKVDQSLSSDKLSKLMSVEDRMEWEQLFHNTFIKPVIEDFETCLLQNIGTHSNVDASSLFEAVYIAPITGKSIWQMCSQPTPELFYHSVLDNQLKKTHPVLFTFLSKGHCLAATQCIADILTLQNKISNRKEVKEDMSFKKFIGQLKDENEAWEYKKLLNSLAKAWKLCRNCLLNYKRLDVSEVIQVVDISEDILMKYLLPNTWGPGVLTTALVDHLTIAHNTFIRQSRKYVENTLHKNWLWKGHEVHLSNVSQTDTIHYQDSLTQLVTAHSLYAVNISGTLRVEYQLDSMEKDLVQRFLLGKPIITGTLDIPQVAQEKPQSVITRALVKCNVQQTPLPQKVKSDFKTDLRKISVIVDACEALEVVIASFLRSKDDIPKNKKLKDYLEFDLCITDKIRSRQIMEFCNLEHVVGLWRFLQTECAKIKIKNEDDPFTETRKEFKTCLKEHQRKALETTARKRSDLENLLEMLYEFTMTFVQFCDTNDSKNQLQDFFSEFLKQTNSKPIDNLNEIFSCDVLLCHVTDCWKCLVKFEDSVNKVKKRTY